MATRVAQLEKRVKTLEMFFWGGNDNLNLIWKGVISSKSKWLNVKVKQSVLKVLNQL